LNLLLYAYDSLSPFHARAASWWQTCLGSTEPVGVTPVVLLGFERVATNPRAFKVPLTVREAALHVRSWLEQPAVEVVEPGPRHVEQVLTLLEGVGTAGNLVTAAQIAAIAIDHDATVHTCDADFRKFAGLRWLDPIEGVGSRRPRRPREP
jgi:toxin-antitoxin system PIN domain toxin